MDLIFSHIGQNPTIRLLSHTHRRMKDVQYTRQIRPKDSHLFLLGRIIWKKSPESDQRSTWRTSEGGGRANLCSVPAPQSRASSLQKTASAINEPETFSPRAYPQTVCTAMAPEPLLKSTFEAYAPEYLGTQRGTITKVCPFPSAEYWRQRPVIFPSCAVSSGSGASLPASLWGVLCCLEGIKGIIGRESAWCLAWSCRGGLSPGWEDEG